MASYTMRTIDDALWRRVKTRAVSEGVSLKDVVVALLRMYADGLKVKV